MFRRFDTPVGRLVGSALAWTAFSFFFVGLYQALGALLTLGGSCASGGPYAIETECPESVLLFAPLGMFGMFLAAGLAFALAGGFGVSLLAWGWPILFVGLGIRFLLGWDGGQGLIVNILCGVLFIVMGAAPVWFLVGSKSVIPTLVGSRRISGERFAFAGRAQRYFGLTPKDGGGTAAPTPTDWAISLALWVVSVGVGGWLALAAFGAVAAAG
jgi:hypothetical protein